MDLVLPAPIGSRVLGKPSGSDARHRRRTYVSTFGLVRARELACESHAIARAALAQAPGDTSTLQLIADYVLTRRA